MTEDSVNKHAADIRNALAQQTAQKAAAEAQAATTSRPLISNEEITRNRGRLARMWAGEPDTGMGPQAQNSNSVFQGGPASSHRTTEERIADIIRPDPGNQTNVTGKNDPGPSR